MLARPHKRKFDCSGITGYVVANCLSAKRRTRVLRLEAGTSAVADDIRSKGLTSLFRICAANTELSCCRPR